MKVHYANRSRDLEFFVISENSVVIVGRPWLRELELIKKESQITIKSLTSLPSVVKRF